MGQVAVHPSETQRRGFRRGVVTSALVHAAGFALLAWVPTMPSISTPHAITVSLVAPPSAVRAGAAPPKPKPRPPKPAPVVLPKEPSAPQAKPKPEPKPAEPEPVAPEPREYADVLAELRSELGEPEPSEEPAETAAVAPGSGAGVPVPPEVAAWLREARIHVRRNWIVPGNFRMHSLATDVEVELDPSGAIRGEPRVLRGSGNPWYDDGVVRSIRKASPLPPPPEAGRWRFTFVSDEL